MNATETQQQNCPGCGTPMNLESRRTINFNGGRGDTLVDRFHCTSCRRFYNVPVEVKK